MGLLINDVVAFYSCDAEDSWTELGTITDVSIEVNDEARSNALLYSGGEWTFIFYAKDFNPEALEDILTAAIQQTWENIPSILVAAYLYAFMRVN